MAFSHQMNRTSFQTHHSYRGHGRGRGNRVSERGQGSRVSERGRGNGVSERGRGNGVSERGRWNGVSERGRGNRVCFTLGMLGRYQFFPAPQVLHYYFQVNWSMTHLDAPEVVLNVGIKDGGSFNYAIVAM